jgi:hypothetical protein
MTIREFMREYEGGAFCDESFETAYEAGWRAWFCPVSSLKRRLDKLYPKIKEVVQSEKINIDTMQMLFQNNCPDVGSLYYDEFKICDMKTGEIIYAIVPRSEHKSDKGRAELWGMENVFNGPLVAGSWETIKTYFGI